PCGVSGSCAADPSGCGQRVAKLAQMQGFPRDIVPEGSLAPPRGGVPRWSGTCPGWTCSFGRTPRRGVGPVRGSREARRATGGSSVKTEPAATMRGALAVPGVKGISQRAVLLGALADGESRIRGFGRAGDTESAIVVARAIGAEVIEDADEELRVRGV